MGKPAKHNSPNEPAADEITAKAAAEAGSKAARNSGKSSEAPVKNKKSKQAPPPVRVTRSSAK